MNIERIEQRFEVIQMAEGFVSAYGLAIAASIIGNGMPTGVSHSTHLLGPHAFIANAGVQKNYREPVALLYPLDGCPTNVDRKGFCAHFRNSLCDTGAEGNLFIGCKPTAVLLSHWEKPTQLVWRPTGLATGSDEIAKTSAIGFMGEHENIVVWKCESNAAAIDRNVTRKGIETRQRAFPRSPQRGHRESAAEQQCRSRQKPLHQIPQKAKAAQPRWFCTAYSRKSSGRRGFSHTPATMVKQALN
jgi:hypothetical protein